MTNNLITIRPVIPDDAPAVAALSGELGYPASLQDMQDRLGQITQQADHAIYVAEHAEAGVIGWVHVHVAPLLQSSRQAEVGGLVVSAAHRRCGAGQRLMQCAEQWAQAQHCEGVRLRSRIVREDAHTFYRQLGYQVTKTSLTFLKVLPEPET